MQSHQEEKENSYTCKLTDQDATFEISKITFILNLHFKF